MKIKVKGDGATSVYYWGVESDHFDQKENNAFNQFIKDKLPDYYELDNKLRLTSERHFDESSTQEERDKATQEDSVLYQQLEASRKEKYNAAILDFMKDRPFSARMIEELRMIASRDQIPTIIEKAREIFKKAPQEAMNDERVAETKAKLKYADYQERLGEQNTDKAKIGEQTAKKAKIGEQMKDFTLFDRKGNKHQLSEFKGKYTILEFTFFGCGGCVFIKPYLEEFYKRNKDKVEVVAIYHDTEKNWMAEEERYKASYHEWISNARSAEPVAAYGVTLFPTFVIIDPNGKILEMPAGSSGFLNVFKYIPDAEVEKKLKEAIKS
jgi:thiol-disulfide isomerase/thioredoxin